MEEVRGQYWELREDGRIHCLLCPKACTIAEGGRGACRVRSVRGGALVLPLYARVSSLALDPIEKKPLYHFLPGSRILSAGFLGCNLHCPFCQNWEISQKDDVPTRFLPPAELVEAAVAAASPSIAYTYSEPIVHIEYVAATMAIARRRGLRNVLVTNGCVNPEPASALLALADAVNVDLKCWSADDYGRVLGGDREAVLGFIRAAARSCHAEVTTLVVPGLSDSREDIRSIASFLSSISPDIPLHLSAYHPAWKHRAPPTDPGLLSELAGVARGELRFVYVGNVAGGRSDSDCPRCGARLVRRSGYDAHVVGLIKKEGRAECSACGLPLGFVLG